MKRIILITTGDPAGIGPEIALKAVKARRVRRICVPVLVGSLNVLKQYSDTIKGRFAIKHVSRPRDAVCLPSDVIPVIDPGPFIKGSVKVGVMETYYGRAALSYVTFAAKACLSKEVHAMVTCPLCKRSVLMSGARDFSGHTEHLVRIGGDKPYAMGLYCYKDKKHMAVAHVSSHISLRRALNLVTKKNIVRTALLLNDFIKSIGIKRPLIAISGLNPHSAESGMFGKEEAIEIIPAVKLLRQGGVYAEGPVSPDVVFSFLKSGRYHGVVALYHDQGHIAFKTMLFSFGKRRVTHGVNVTMGLPFIRTSVDHGTAFDIAAMGMADETSLIEAIELARRMVVK